jgi:hypothetical protein
VFFVEIKKFSKDFFSKYVCEGDEEAPPAGPTGLDVFNIFGD